MCGLICSRPLLATSPDKDRSHCCFKVRALVMDLWSLCGSKAPSGPYLLTSRQYSGYDCNVVPHSRRAPTMEHIPYTHAHTHAFELGRSFGELTEST